MLSLTLFIYLKVCDHTPERESTPFISINMINNEDLTLKVIKRTIGVFSYLLNKKIWLAHTQFQVGVHQNCFPLI